MTELQAYLTDPHEVRNTPERIEALRRIVARAPWCTAARQALAHLAGGPDPRLAVVAPWRGISSLGVPGIAADRLLEVTPEELIDRFLCREDLRIVAREEGPEGEVRTEADLSDDDEVVSEELAEIYAAQGLRDEAVAIYRKLSLRNTEKSVYFAELIRKLEENNN